MWWARRAFYLMGSECARRSLSAQVIAAPKDQCQVETVYQTAPSTEEGINVLLLGGQQSDYWLGYDY